MPRPANARELRAAVHGFVRGFGLLSATSTPCGKPLPVSYAHALMVLLEAKAARARPSQSELCATLGIDKSNVARLCRRMEREGHLAQETCPLDARVRRLALTAKGERLARQVEAASRRRFEAVLDALPASRRQRVITALEELQAAVREAAGAADDVNEPEETPP